MATKNNRRTLMTKKLLKDSLLELLDNASITNITIKEICEKADLNRSTFYLHYLDQFDLLNEIQSEFLDMTLDCIQDIDTTKNTIGYVSEFLKIIKKEEHLFRVLLCNHNDEDFERKYIMNSMNLLKIRIFTTFPKEIESYAISFLVEGSLATLKTWVLNGCQTPIDTMANFLYNICSNAIS